MDIILKDHSKVVFRDLRVAAKYNLNRNHQYKLQANSTLTTLTK